MPSDMLALNRRTSLYLHKRTSLALHIATLFRSQPANRRGQIQQVFCTEQRSALGDRDKGIDSDDVSPAGRERNQLLFVVVEVDSILTPGTLVRNQFKRLAPPRMERVNDVKDSCRNVMLRRSCQCGPIPGVSGWWELRGESVWIC